MKAYGVNELRKMYLEFFESKEHLRLKSFSLIPHNDKSLLLINSGMAPMKPYFTGQEIPPRKRVTTCQKCIRTGDIENVGKTARKIAAAKTREQLRMVISEIRNDMQVVKNGMEKGYCDESEMAKVEMLMSMAQNQMGQVEDREATPEEKNMFAMASLM